MTPFAAPTMAALTVRLAADAIPCLEDAAAGEAFAAGRGETLLLFLEDPARVPECWDLAVILPELLRGTPLRVAALAPSAARGLSARYGIRVSPALLLLRDGGYVGAIEGLRDWTGYQSALATLRALPVSRPPAIGVAVQGAGPSSCH